MTRIRTNLRRRPRRLLPSCDGALEPRTLCSADLARPPAVIDSNRIARDRIHAAVNITYPTPSGPSEQLNVYSPAGTPPPGGWPVMLAIHGGGWRRFSKDEYGPRIARGFVPRGFVVVAPNYQLSAHDRSSWPTNLEDVQAAVAWIRDNASSLGVNSRRIVAIGESAGGNLATLLGVTTEPAGVPVPPQVSAVIGFSSPTDLTRLYSQSPLAGLAEKQFLGGTPGQIPGEYAAASPLDHVAPGDAPMFLVHGGQDPLVPSSQSVLLGHALAAAGVPNRLVIVPGGHKLDFPIHDADLIPQILDFLKAVWNS